MKRPRVEGDWSPIFGKAFSLVSSVAEFPWFKAKRLVASTSLVKRVWMGAFKCQLSVKI